MPRHSLPVTPTSINQSPEADSILMYEDLLWRPAGPYPRCCLGGGEGGVWGGGGGL